MVSKWVSFSIPLQTKQTQSIRFGLVEVAEEWTTCSILTYFIFILLIDIYIIIIIYFTFIQKQQLIYNVKMRNSWITTEQQQHKPLVGKLETYSQTKGAKAILGFKGVIG